MIFKEKQKSQPISKRQVWDAFKAVKSNDGSAGVDNIDIVEIESHPGKYLYPLWNRMASGSYMPVPVRKLEIKQEKSNIVYCKRNQKNHPPFKPKYVQFDFLGFTFKPRWIMEKGRKPHLAFTPAISNKRRKRIGQTLYKLKIHRMVQFSLLDIAILLEPKIRGCINYYGKFRFSEMRKVFRVLNPTCTIAKKLKS